MPDWTLYARNPDGDRKGQIEAFSDALIVPRFNDVGTWQLQGVPASHARALGLHQPMWGVEFVRDDVTVLSGIWTERSRSFSQDADTFEFVGVDDNIWLAWRLMHPQPATAAPPYSSQAYDVRTGVLSTVMRQYVDVNAGPSALIPRRVTGFTLAADPVLGPTYTGRGRWEPLLTFLQAAATVGGLGFRVVGLEFEVYDPVDRTGDVVFSTDIGNLLGFSHTLTAGDGNYLYVGGDGEETTRTIVERGDYDEILEWGRIEKFHDQRTTTDAGELQDAALAKLAESTSKVGVSISPLDIAGRAFLTDYQLGDRISVVVDDETIADVVTAVQIVLNDKGEQTAPTVGTDFQGVRFFDHLDDLDRRTRKLEVR